LRVESRGIRTDERIGEACRGWRGRVGHGREALARLDHVLRDHPALLAAELTDAVRGVVALRGEMIVRRDRDGPGPAVDQRLERVNAILSMLIGSEFPLTGARWQRIERARDVLREILAEEEAPTRAG
jgi:formate dehydrogenase major subunit